MNILVLGGGVSGEREVSLQSAAAVRRELVLLGHEVGYLDPQDGLDKLAAEAPKYDLVLPILHGADGENGHIQQVLDEANVPYLGAGVKASALCIDKVRMKNLLKSNGILTPESEVVTAETFSKSPLTKQPFVLKTVDGGSSVGILIARELPYDERTAAGLLSSYPEMLLEQLIEGSEITVPVLGNEALPVIEIVPPEGGEFDYEHKYDGTTQELCPPVHVSQENQEQAQRLAERIHKLAGVRHLSRTDMIVSDHGIYVLEVNTLPGMTSQSLYPKGAAAAGLNFGALVARFVDLAGSPVKSG